MLNIKQAERIEELVKTTADLIVAVAPETSKEWQALEKLTAAHKQLRSIDTFELRQPKMKLDLDKPKGE